MAKRTESSRRWLQEHFNDPYVKKAQASGYRSRAVFKLLEMQERGRLFSPGMTVVDLGAAPGGWSQVLASLVKSSGRVIAMDILPMDPLPGVEIIHGDFADEAILQQLLDTLGEDAPDWVVSDIAPNLSGNPGIDMPRVLYLAELALDFAVKTIKPQGGFLIKIFQGPGSEAFLAEVKRQFKVVTIRKPKASRGRSREVYVVAKGLKQPS